VSSLNVFFRDTEHILGVLMLAWFFMTPIIYEFSLIPSGFEYLACFNPMTGIVTAYRDALLSQNPMTPAMIRLSLAVAWGSLLAGILLFHKLEPAFADEL